MGEGILRTPVGRASAVGFLATERYLSTKTSPTGHVKEGSAGSEHYSSEDRLFQLRKAEKACVVFLLAVFNHSCVVACAYLDMTTLNVRFSLVYSQCGCVCGHFSLSWLCCFENSIYR